MENANNQNKAVFTMFENPDESFRKLPQELQEKSIALSREFKRAIRATKQFALWRREHEAAEAALKIARADHGDALNRWDPDTNTMTELEDAPERVLKD